MRALIVLTLFGIQAIAIVAYFQSKSPAKFEHPGRSLLSLQQKVELQFEDYLKSKKTEVLAEYQGDAVQKLSRSSLRKQYAFKSKAESNFSTIRYSVYTVDASKEPAFRKVYDDYKSPLVWDKILEMLVTQALKSTGEGAEAKKGSQMEKFSEMISMVMKDNGLAKIQEPGNFNTFSLFGQDTVMYWNTIVKRCPSRVRKDLGIEDCVKGLFLAEIDRKNLVRDFANENSVKNSIHGLALVDRDEILELYPMELAYSESLAIAFGNAIKSNSRQYFTAQDGRESLLVYSRVIPSAMLALTLDER